MRSSNNSKNFRAYVPLILNGKVVQWYFETGESVITMDVPMRKYAKDSKTDWVAQPVRITFERKTRNHQPYKSKNDSSYEFTCELYYSCDNNRVTFEEGYIPVIN
jgi:hypothetical protein